MTLPPRDTVRLMSPAPAARGAGARRPRRKGGIKRTRAQKGPTLPDLKAAAAAPDEPVTPEGPLVVGMGGSAGRLPGVKDPITNAFDVKSPQWGG